MGWQSFILFKNKLCRDVFYEVIPKSCYFCTDLSQNMDTMWLSKFWSVDFQETSSQEPLKGLNWNLVYMFLWMSLTCVVSVCAIWKFKMATGRGQSLHWNPMGNNIFIFFLRTAEHNLTKPGRDVSCELLKCCPGLY